MTNFEELRSIIGKDLHVKLKKLNEEGYGTITLNWEWQLGLTRKVFRIADEYRTNPLSKEKGGYTLIYSLNSQDRIYPNVYDYVAYLQSVLDGNRKSIKLPDYDFIYVWDSENNKLIIVWENDREERRFRLGEVFAKSWLDPNEYDTAINRGFPNLEIIK